MDRVVRISLFHESLLDLGTIKDHERTCEYCTCCEALRSHSLSKFAVERSAWRPVDIDGDVQMIGGVVKFLIATFSL